MVERYPESFPKLTSYLFRMRDLVNQVSNATCLGCKKKFNYYKFENIFFGVKADSPVCEKCYYDKGLEKLVQAGKVLG